MENLVVSNFSRYFILYKRAGQFVRIAILLHGVSIVGLILCFGCGQLALLALKQSRHLFFICYGYLSIYGVILIFFTQMDAVSRFQNYKLAKDLFFENGFKKRIANLFISSRCQREAIRVAAIDLGMINELDAYYDSLGYRWFHVIPDIFFSKPQIIFTRKYWKKTLFVKEYKSKYFLW